MAIISHKISLNTKQAHGEYRIVVIAKDHLDQDHVLHISTRSVVGLDALIDKRIEQFDEHLKQEEALDAVSIIEDGGKLPVLEFATTDQVRDLMLDSEVQRTEEVNSLTAKRNNLTTEIGR